MNETDPMTPEEIDALYSRVSEVLKSSLDVAGDKDNSTKVRIHNIRIASECIALQELLEQCQTEAPSGDEYASMLDGIDFIHEEKVEMGDHPPFLTERTRIKKLFLASH